MATDYFNDNDVQTVDFKPDNFFDNWYTDCIKEKEYFLDWGSPLLNEAFRGAKEGTTILMAGSPNYGKSSLLTSIILNILNNNKDLVVVDFTIDDPINKRLTQYIANLSKLEMNTVDFANNIDNNVKRERFNQSCLKVKGWVNNKELYLYESSTDETNQSSISFIIKTLEDIRKTNPNKKIVASIDSINDIEPGIRTDDTMLRSESVAKELNRLVNRTDSLLLATTHLRKNGGRRPTLEDLKGNNFLAYSAKCAIGIFNDIKQNKDKAKVHWTARHQDGTQSTMPVIEAHFLKSKISSFNEAIMFKQIPAMAYVQEADEATQKILQQMMFGAI